MSKGKSRSKSKGPTYRRHAPTDTARCWLNGKWKSLGKYNSPESHEAFARVLAEYRSAPLASAVGSPQGELTVDEVALAFWKFAEEHYRRADGTQTNELTDYRLSIRALRKTYGRSPAASFGPKALKAVRQTLIEVGLKRPTINARVRRIKRLFKWAASEELVPAGTYHALATVTGLSKGRSPAPESEPVTPIALEHVTATLPHLPAPVRGLVLFALHTGCRPDEACRVRPSTIDRSGDVWMYRPDQHKNAHRGKSRVIAIGPKARAVLAEFEPAGPDEYYFSPQRAVAERNAARSAARKTPRYPSHMKRNAAKRTKAPKKPPRAHYSAHSFGTAILRGVRLANNALIEAAVDIELHVPHWAPNQLRHAHGTAVRHRYGLEAAQVALGHARADVTQIYAEKNLALAAKVAAEIG